MCLDFEHRSLFFNHMTKYSVLTATCSVNVVDLILLFGSIVYGASSTILCTKACTVILAPSWHYEILLCILRRRLLKTHYPGFYSNQHSNSLST
jgi:hypothetical protein